MIVSLFQTKRRQKIESTRKERNKIEKRKKKAEKAFDELKEAYENGETVDEL